MRATRMTLPIAAALFIAALLSGCGGGGGGGSSYPAVTEDGAVQPGADLSAAGTAVLSWTAPAENTDGSALTNLAGFRIYYGTSKDDYDRKVDIHNPSLSEYVIDNIPTGHKYYFTITAFDSSGVESVKSNIATKSL